MVMDFLKKISRSSGVLMMDSREVKTLALNALGKKKNK